MNARKNAAGQIFYHVLRQVLNVVLLSKQALNRNGFNEPPSFYQEGAKQ
jgi:hypothetical protein